MEFIQSMVSWDRQRKRLKPYQFKTMFDIVNGKEQLTPQNAKYCLFNYYTLYKYGYRWSGK
ncbi:MAG: hypothetical protein WAT46_16315 [Saprospiraceae bacterium]